MRITFVLPYAGFWGGIRVVAIYAEGLKRRGHKVVVVSTPPDVPIRRKIKSFLLGHGWFKNDPEPSHFAGRSVEHRVVEHFRPIVDADVPDADVVVATMWLTAYWVRELSPAKGAKVLLLQGYEVEDGKPNPKLDLTWCMPMHKIAVSEWLARLAREKFGNTAVSLVPNAVDLEQFHAEPRAKQANPTVGLLYSKSWFKGCRTSLAALDRVAARFPTLRVLSFGAEHPGTVRLRLPAYVEFHYRPPQDKLKELYAQCDVWLCGSNRDGFSLPPLEAMACRCPVVSTKTGALPELIEEGVNGHLVEVGDADALADRVSRVLSLSQDRWRQMSDAAYVTAVRYTWNDATDLFEKALELAIERDRHASG